MSLNKPYRHLVESLIPEYIKDDYPLYVDFVKQYLSMCEEESGPFEVILNLPKLIDVSAVEDNNLVHFLNQYISSFPDELLHELDLRKFIKDAKTFYSHKGNEKSFRFIFNLLRGELRMFYPHKYIFNVSDDKSTLSGLPRDTANEKIHKLHDNEYWAYYTYEILSDLDITVYEQIIKQTVHPAGFKMFAVKLIEMYGEEDADLKSPIIINENIYQLDSYDLISMKPVGLKTSINSTKTDNFKDTLSGIIEYYYDFSITLQMFARSFYWSLDYYTSNVSTIFDYTMFDFYYTEPVPLINDGTELNNLEFVNVQRASEILISTI